MNQRESLPMNRRKTVAFVVESLADIVEIPVRR